MGHRLDRQTSGICLYSKNKDAARRYSEILMEETIHKVYIARVIGKIDSNKFTIAKRKIITVNLAMYHVSLKNAVHNCVNGKEDFKDSKDAITDIKVVSYSPSLNCTIIKCYLKTGRTHQIRVHLKSINHPIENDRMYRTICEVEKELVKWKAIPDKEKIYMLPNSPKGVEFIINEENDVIPNIPAQDFDEIYLHAYKYKFGKYKFVTKFPDWEIGRAHV